MRNSRPETDLVVLQTHPIQYYAPLYRTLAERGHMRVHVVYLTDAGSRSYHDPGFSREVQWDIPLLEGYESTVLEPGMELSKTGFLERHSHRLVRVLDELAPKWLLIYGYASRMNWVARKWATRHGVQLAYSSDSNINDPRKSWKHWVKRPLLKRFFRAVNVALCTSEANEAYIRQYAPSNTRLRRMPFAIDVARFSRDPQEPSEDRPFDLVWAGKFLKHKRPQDFISALGEAAALCNSEIRARMIGDGPLREHLESQAKSLPTSVRLDFDGFVNQNEMPAALQSAHALAFTSEREPYGLIAAEAAAAGLALILSDRIGCLGKGGPAQMGRNTLVYQSGDVDGLAQHMVMLLRNRKLRCELQRESLGIARSHRFVDAAKVIEDALHE
jgi:glycosyltransferase involved in cell wall biosynthesis